MIQISPACLQVTRADSKYPVLIVECDVSLQLLFSMLPLVPLKINRLCRRQLSLLFVLKNLLNAL